jgi:hypothetical protein
MSSKTLSKLLSVPVDIMSAVLEFLSPESIRNIIGDVKNPLRDTLKYVTFPLNIDTIGDFLLANEFVKTQLFISSELQRHVCENETFFNHPYRGKTVHGKSKTLRLKNFVSRIKHAEIFFDKLRDSDHEFIYKIPSLRFFYYENREFFTGTHTSLIFHPTRIDNIVVEKKMDTLDLSKSEIKNIEILARVENLILAQTTITDVTNFRNIHTLDISQTLVENVSSLGNVHTLNLSGCINVDDVSALGKVHTLNLSGCRSVTNVSMLGGVYELDLSFTTPRGINKLEKVHKLSLAHCQELTNQDISTLGDVYDLNLTGTFISNISNLKNVFILKLGFCSHIVDFSVLGNQEFLDLRETNITNVSHLGKTRKLCLSNCLNVVDVSMLGGVENLDLTGCYNIVDFSVLGNIKHLNLSCTRVTDLSFVKTVHTLDLFSCRFITTGLSHLQSVRSLNLNHCNIDSHIFNFPILENLCEIDVSHTFIYYPRLVKMKNLKIVYDEHIYYPSHERILKKNGIKLIQSSMYYYKLF